MMIGSIADSAGEILSGDVATMLYWSLAVAGTLFFVIVLLMAGAGAGVDNPSEVASDGTFDSVDHVDTGFSDFQFISLKTVLAFATVFGWGGVIWGKTLTGFLVSFALGLAAMSLTALVIWGMLRLQHSGTIHAADFVGKTGTVYLGIPGKRAGQGRATVSVGGSTSEIAAVSDEELPTGTQIRVLEHLDSTVYLVGKL